ncbi:MAG: TIGR03790 family protein [Phycisphaerae bacterium]
MTPYRSLLASLAVLAALASGASALSPDQVLIVANADVPDSLAVAAYYAQQRQIDPSQVVTLKTTGGYNITREDYESQILNPLRATLVQRGLTEKIRCLALMWGMPVRVLAPQNALGELLITETTKTHYRLAVDYKLLATVGRKFPPPRTEGLAPLADLFESPAPPPPEPLPEWAALLKDADALVGSKLSELSTIRDDPNRAIATRQLTALQFDIHGLEGLIQFLRQAKLATPASLERLQKLLDDGRAKLTALRAAPEGVDNAKAMLAILQQVGGAAAVEAYGQEHKPSTEILRAADASVDSELAMLWWQNYPLDRQMPNLLCWRVHPPSSAPGEIYPPVLLTARIDGPSKADAMRIIHDSVQTEKTGLTGTFYIDAGGPERAKHYDDVLRALAQFVRTRTRIPVVLDESSAVFPPDSCPNAALYVGWYSLQKYVPAFQWIPGSVGWHIASFEAMHLRDPNSPEWCPQMIRNGIAATLGAVDEPTLNTMPQPTDFFALLLTGQYTVAECYWRSVPTTSWRLTLIADPLYNPFKANPQIQLQDLPAGLAPPPQWGAWPAGLMANTSRAPAAATASAPTTATAPASP